MTCAEDAHAAVRAGADAIGLVFYAPSSRAVTVEQAKQICQDLPPFVTVVALTVNAEKTLLEQIISELPVDLLQFHGDETPEQCAQYGRPYIKAIRMKDGVNLLAEAECFSGAQALLLDAYQKGVPGGTGERFDWQRIPKALAPKIILAGGLNPGNVAEAVAAVAPYAVDVSGGVELDGDEPAKGRKDHDKIQQFIKQLNNLQ
jgi:phosphoribosylanthranilate isomerase